MENKEEKSKDEKPKDKASDKPEQKTPHKDHLIAVIRISGMVKVKPDIKNTLHRLKLRRKYSCILLKPIKDLLGMLEKVKYSIAYGEIDKKTLEKLLEARAEKIGSKDKGKVDANKIAEELIAGKTLEELGFKGFFRLHPPRKGIKSKIQYPKGVLGNNKESINKLIERML